MTSTPLATRMVGSSTNARVALYGRAGPDEAMHDVRWPVINCAMMGFKG